MELTIQIVPHERTARLREVRALAGGDVCSLLLTDVRDARPDLRLALYSGADMETLVASCPSFSPVPGHASSRSGTLDLSTEEMGDWFEAEKARLDAADAEAAAAGRRPPSRDPSAPVPAFGWLLVFDSGRTWASCRVPVLLRPADPGAEGVTPVGSVLAGKADKVPSATAGNLAALDASGNLVDSGVSPSSVAHASIDATLTREGAAADAKAVGDALRGGFTAWEFALASGEEIPPDLELSMEFDTNDGMWELTFGRSGQTEHLYQGGLVSDTEVNFSFLDAPFMTAIRHLVTPTKTSQLTNDSGFLTEQGVGGKLDGAAVYPAWQPGDSFDVGVIRSYNGRLYRLLDVLGAEDADIPPPDNLAFWEEVDVGALKQDALSPAQTNAVNSGVTAAKVAAWDGYAAQIAAKANASDVNAALALKAAASDLPYAMVTPGEWTIDPADATFHGSPVKIAQAGDGWQVFFDEGGGSYAGGISQSRGDASSLRLEWAALSEWAGDVSIVATRASLPGHLCDRAVNAVNAVEVMGGPTLTLPAANPGRSRDLYVRLTVSASSTVTWSVTSGESWDAMGAPPSSFAAGTYLYRFTEVAAGVWHCEDMLALAGKQDKYQMVAVSPSSGTLTVVPYTVATYTAGSSAEAFEVAVGTGTTGKVRDCELVIDCTAMGAVAPTVTWPATFHPRTDAGTDFACEAGKRNVYYISEYAPGEFAVGGWQETSGGNA